MLHHMPMSRKHSRKQLSPDERVAALTAQLAAVQEKVAGIAASGQSYSGKLDLANIRDDLKEVRDDIVAADIDAGHTSNATGNTHLVDRMIEDLDIMSEDEDFLNDEGLARHNALWAGAEPVGGSQAGEVEVSGYTRADGTEVGGYSRRRPS